MLGEGCHKFGKFALIVSCFRQFTTAWRALIFVKSNYFDRWESPKEPLDAI